MAQEDRVNQERSQLQLDDLERMNFMGVLDASERVEVSDWEAGFIESFLGNPRPMTDPQRKVVDDMRKRYGHRL